MATTIVASFPDILESYERRLTEQSSPLLRTETSRSQMFSHARQLLYDLVDELTEDHEKATRRTLAADIGATRAAQGFHPGESLRAAGVLFEVLMRSVAGQVTGPQAAHSALLVSLGMNAVLVRALGQAADSYSGFLLNRIHSAHLEERRRISRELHDRIGHGVSVAHRNIELFEIYRETQPVQALSRIQVAHRAVLETLDAVREVISDLRLAEPVDSLEKEIQYFLDTVQHDDLVAHVEVNGDEHWASPEVRDEVFLILREALRNVLAHANAGRVLVRVQLTPDELRATIRDDGVGFDPAEVSGSKAGIVSMRERVALLDGTVTVTSAPGRGTTVDLLVPLREA